MKKIIGILLVAFLLSTTTVKAAPSWQSYVTLLNSEEYLKLVDYQSKFYAKDVIGSLPTPSTSQEIAIYNAAHDVLSVKWDSPMIRKIAGYVTNDTYLTNISDWQQIGGDILTALQGGCGSYTVFACIFGVY